MERNFKSCLAAFILLLVVSASFNVAAVSRGMKVDPDSYPEIKDEELGQLRWVLQIADQPLDDFTNMEGIDQYGMTSYRYCIAFMNYFLAIEQYHKLPACPEIIQPRMDRFIQKILQKPVWEFWAEISQGVPAYEPKLNKPYPEEHDPVAKRNIMYSGHVGHMIGLYETLYRDFKWEEPCSIVFAWSDDEKYMYDYHKLNKVMYEQMRHNPAHCIECEPNACFPECNQHPIMSFMLYDSIHGTNLMEASGYFLDFFLEEKMIHPRTHETAVMYLVKQDLTFSNSDPRLKNILDVVTVPAISIGIVACDSGSADGWTGTFMHIWQPEYIERHYPYQRKNNLRDVDEEKARLAVTWWEPQLKYGFFAMLAAEMGDFETSDKLINFADEKYKPVWQNGTLHYPYSNSNKCTNLTGKLIAFARANPKNGVWKMHNEPFDDLHFSEPKVAGIDFPSVVLRRAIYDREKKALVVTTEPGAEKGGSTSLRFIQLDAKKSYTLCIDGSEAATYRGRSEAVAEVMLDGRHDLVLTEN